MAHLLNARLTTKNRSIFKKFDKWGCGCFVLAPLLPVPSLRSITLIVWFVMESHINKAQYIFCAEI